MPFFPPIGDVPGPLSVDTGAIQNDAVTNAKLAEMATHTVKGNITAGTANPTDLTRTQLTAELNPATNLLPGAMPAWSFAGDLKTSAVALTGGNQTIQPGTLGVSRVVLPAATQAGNATLTLGVTSCVTGQILDVVILDVSANTYAIVNNAAAAIATKGASAAARTYRCTFGVADWSTTAVHWLTGT